MSKFKSRKFWLSVVGALLVIANKGLDLGLPESTINAVAALIIGYVVCEAAVDVAAAKK